MMACYRMTVSTDVIFCTENGGDRADNVCRGQKFIGAQLTCDVTPRTQMNEKLKRINRRADSGDELVPWMRRPKILQSLSRTAVYSIISRRCYIIFWGIQCAVLGGQILFCVSQNYKSHLLVARSTSSIFSRGREKWHVLPWQVALLKTWHARIWLSTKKLVDYAWIYIILPL